mmetsp:Transcript_66588/g.147465  ORF Transcript_66588/g.147465 Transcript_66588/m.147465 type:complete len:1184 (-) Transcript_66588:51-3602(-)
MSSSWTCGQDCADVTWSHVQIQFGLALVPWTIMTTIGLIVARGFPQKAANNRGRFTRYEYGLASSAPGPAAACLCTHGLQCFVFLVRIGSKKVDAIYHALEMMSGLFQFIDVFAAWTFVITHGTGAVLAYSFGGRLLVDCLSATAVAALALPGSDGKATWFSFCFIGSLRMLRICDYMEKSDSGSSWKKQVIFHLMMMSLFVYASAVSILLLERLEDPKTVLDRHYTEWELGPSLFFAFSSMWTLGDSVLAPKTMLGRIFAVALISWGLRHLCTEVAPLLLDIVLGTRLGNGSYDPKKRRCGGGHHVVLGTPTAAMIADFLVEVFHPNHFDGGAGFDRDAPDIVILIPDKQVLAQIRRFLGRREAILFRDHVFPLTGDAFSPEDLWRAATWHARQVVILPNLSLADVTQDDATNIMRTFALSSIVQSVNALCMLHCAESRPSSVSGGHVEFVTIDEFKFSLLAKACVARGSLAYICNLCKTVGDAAPHGKPWLRDYERSLGCEAYEVALSPAYHGATFGEAFEDVLARSRNGDVYLIGFTSATKRSRGGGKQRRSVHLHPGNNFQLQVVDGSIAGVFVAPDLEAIEQCEPGEDLVNLSMGPMVRQSSGALSWLKNRLSTVSNTVSSGLQNVHAAVQKAAANETRRKPRGSPSKEAPGQVPKQEQAQQAPEEVLDELADLDEVPQEVMEVAVPSKAAGPTVAMNREQLVAAKGFKRAMNKIKHRLMVNGLGIELIAGITGALPIDERKENEERFGAAKIAAARRGGEDPDSPLPRLDLEQFAPPKKLKARQWQWENEEQARERELERSQAIYDQMHRDLLRPPGPPKQLIQVGGHLVLCIVSDTTTGKKAGSGFHEFGPSMGLLHFMKPLRDKRIKGQVNQPAVVVLAEALPNDWHTVIEFERLYFVAGSPLNLDDLDRVGFRKAHAIAIARVHSGIKGKQASKVSDARVVLATNLIESNLPHDAQAPVITDHAYIGSCDFLPASKVPIDAAPAVPLRNMSGAGSVPTVFRIFSGGEDAASALKESLDNRGAPLGELDLGVEPCDEIYEDIEASDYAYQHRFMRGEVFVSTILTTLLANTLYNPSLVPLLHSLVKAPMLLLPLPAEWERKSYADFASWLLTERNILVLGMYRSAQASQAAAFQRPLDESIPTHHYVYTAPPAHSTTMIRSDRILCLAPTEVEGK